MRNRINDYHPDGETLEVDWPCHPPRSFHCKNCYALDARRETQAGSPQDHMATDSWEGNKGDGEDLGGHQVHGKGSPDVEGTRCCPTCLLGVKGMNEWMKMKWHFCLIFCGKSHGLSPNVPEPSDVIRTTTRIRPTSKINLCRKDGLKICYFQRKSFSSRNERK